MMMTIGDLAARTGATPRMLRHWEAEGLLRPAAVDPESGRRRYAAPALDRVRAIQELRALGFGLADVATMLKADATETRRVTVLRERAAALEDEIEVATRRLRRVRDRLARLTGQDDPSPVEVEECVLPARQLRATHRLVADTDAIPAAVGVLLDELADSEGDVELVYDGVSDPEVIRVSAGFEAADGTMSVAGGDGVRARFDVMPDSTDGAWQRVDAALAERGLQATGQYRQTLHAAGGTTLSVRVVRTQDARCGSAG